MMRYATVTEVVRRIKDDLQKDYRLQSVAMEGNIINLKRASNGHYYMNIHDDKASLHSILFAGRVGRSMPVVVTLLKQGGTMVTLIKPQFEAGREHVGKGGIVKDRNVHRDVIRTVTAGIADLGLSPAALTFSPIKGAEGNIEYLLYVKKEDTACNAVNDELIDAVVEESHRM